MALRLAFAAVFGMFLGHASPAAAQSSSPAAEIRLSEQVFLVPDPHARSVTGTLVIKAGCADEAGGCLGIAHYLEHLLFINRDGEHRSKVTLFPAGTGNGWTSAKATGYFQTFPVKSETLAADLDKLVGHLAGLLTDVRADEPQAVRERNVVLQEHNQLIGNNAFGRFALKRNALLLPDDPLGQSIGGTPETIRDFTVARAQDFHRTWYAINNAYLVFAGPISEGDLRPHVVKHVEPMPKRPVPQRPWWNKPAPEAKLQSIVESDRDVRQIGVYLDKIVSYEPAADAYGRMIDSGARGIVASFLASRLPGSPADVLMEKEELVTGGSYSIAQLRSGLLRLSFSAIPAAGIPPERVADAMRRYVSEFSPSLISQSYLDRLKRRSAIGDDLMREEPGRYAQALTSWLAEDNSHDAWKQRAEARDAVTLRHVEAVMAAIARPGREVSAVLRPAGAP